MYLRNVLFVIQIIYIAIACNFRKFRLLSVEMTNDDAEWMELGIYRSNMSQKDNRAGRFLTQVIVYLSLIDKNN